MDDLYNQFINKDIEQLSGDEAKEFLLHLRKQFKERYTYLVGEWQNARRAKNTRDGQFVSREEVIDFLQNK